MSRDPRLYLEDILEAIDAVREYTQGVSREEFLKNRLIQDAVIRRIEIIGEAARQLPSAISDQAPDIPWADIVAMRNRLTHGYFGVLLDRVWNTLHQDLPELRRAITAMRESLDE